MAEGRRMSCKDLVGALKGGDGWFYDHNLLYSRAQLQSHYSNNGSST